MSKDGETKLYLDKIKITIKDATQQVLEAVAFQVEGLAKINIQQNGQIDTGYMLNSVYTVTPQSSGFAAAAGAAGARNPNAAMESAPTVAEGAAVVVGANYAIYQEVRLPFLYPAAEEAARQAGGTAEQIYREVVK